MYKLYDNVYRILMFIYITKYVSKKVIEHIGSHLPTPKSSLRGYAVLSHSVIPYRQYTFLFQFERNLAHAKGNTF